MMINSDLQRDEFQGRLNRIKKGGPNMLGQVYVGPAEEPGALTDLKPHFGIMATLLALIVGALAYGVGSLFQFHTLSDDGKFTVERLGESGAQVAANFGDMFIAVLAVIILLKIVRLSGFAPYLVAALGLFGMMGLHSKAVNALPEFYSTLYSESYVAQFQPNDPYSELF